MNLPKAIEILSLNVKEAGKRMPADTLTALHIGIEAIKFRLELEQADPEITLEPLAHQTKD